jgi:hypothetical protein
MDTIDKRAAVALVGVIGAVVVGVHSCNSAGKDNEAAIDSLTRTSAHVDTLLASAGVGRLVESTSGVGQDLLSGIPSRLPGWGSSQYNGTIAPIAADSDGTVNDIVYVDRLGKVTLYRNVRYVQDSIPE